jgi:hypothetical protein
MYLNAAHVLRIHQQVIVPRAQVRSRRGRRAWKHLLPPVLLFSALLLQLTIRIEIIERGYRLENLREQALKQDNHLRSERLELAFATRPKILTDEAKQRLHMLALCPQRVRQLSAEQ